MLMKKSCKLCVMVPGSEGDIYHWTDVLVMGTDTGKVLGVEALTILCTECGHYEKLDKNSVAYLRRKLEHKNCKANFKSSAQAMEPEGAACIFARSVLENNVQYTKFMAMQTVRALVR